MHLALTDLFRARWSNTIHEEWMRNLLANRPDLKRAQLERTRDLMNLHIQDCLVEGYELLIPGLSLPDPDDRHVLAAAVRAGADVIVTYNLRDFPVELLAPFEIEAQHPDDFVLHLLNQASETVCAAVKRQRATLKNPPKSVEEFLDILTQQSLLQTAARLRTFAELI
jgi:predicted nucleic acid-binding protein